MPNDHHLGVLFFLGTLFLKTWQTEIEKTILKIDGIEKIILKIKEEAKEKEPSLSHQKWWNSPIWESAF